MKSLSFLIDTDWVIDHLNAVAEVTRRLKELEPQGLALSIISAAELWEGVYFSRDQKRSPSDAGGFSVGCNYFESRRRSLQKVRAPSRLDEEAWASYG